MASPAMSSWKLEPAEQAEDVPPSLEPELDLIIREAKEAIKLMLALEEGLRQEQPHLQPENLALSEKIPDLVAFPEIVATGANLLGVAEMLDLLEEWSDFPARTIFRAGNTSIKSLAWVGEKRDDRLMAVEKDLPQASSDPVLLARYATSSLYLERYDQAIRYYLRAIRANPKDAALYNNLRDALAGRGDYPPAIDALQTALQIRPTYALARANLGNVYALDDDLERAKIEYDRVLAAQPALAEVYFNRGQLYARQGQYQQAGGDYSLAIKYGPTDARFYYFRGIAWLKQKCLALAQADFEQALKADPRHAPAYLYRSLIDTTRAANQAPVRPERDRAAQASWRSAAAAVIQARLDYRQGEYQAALDLYTQALALCPTWADVRFERAMVHFKLGQPAAATADLADLSPQAGRFPQAQQALELWQSGQKRPADRLAHLSLINPAPADQAANLRKIISVIGDAHGPHRRFRADSRRMKLVNG